LDAPPLANGAIGLSAIPGLDAQPLPPNAPLGDVARHFRQLKFSQALQRSAEFHLLLLEAPVLGSPKRLQPLLSPLPTSEPAPPPPGFNVASPSPILKPASPRVSPLAPSLQPARPSLSVPAPSRPRFAPSQAPSQAIVKRSPFARPPASVFVSPRLTPSQPLAAPAAPAPPPAVRVPPAPPVAPSAKPRVATPVAPAPSAKRNVIVVQPGDSLWKLAEQNLGQGLRWRDFLAVNPGILNPDHIVAGTQLYLPAAVSPFGVSTKFTVRQGDTLWSIAQAQFGRASAWSCIAQANPAIRDANRIYIGQSLTLPSSCKP
jgi:nucleoid-associated protein YgaU